MNVQFLVGDLTRVETEAIVNPANSEGEMGGGVAAAIKKAGGAVIEDEAMAKAPVHIGSAIVTTAGKLKCECVIHAPTMKVPVQRTNVENIARATQAALELARECQIKSMAVPGMGTGTGRVSLEEAAAVMIKVVREFADDPGCLQEILLVDRNQQIVAAWKTCWNLKNEPETPGP